MGAEGTSSWGGSRIKSGGRRAEIRRVLFCIVGLLFCIVGLLFCIVGLFSAQRAPLLGR